MWNHPARTTHTGHSSPCTPVVHNGKVIHLHIRIRVFTRSIPWLLLFDKINGKFLEINVSIILDEIHVAATETR